MNGEAPCSLVRTALAGQLGLAQIGSEVALISPSNAPCPRLGVEANRVIGVQRMALECPPHWEDGAIGELVTVRVPATQSRVAAVELIHLARLRRVGQVSDVNVGRGRLNARGMTPERSVAGHEWTTRLGCVLSDVHNIRFGITFLRIVLL